MLDQIKEIIADRSGSNKLDISLETKFGDLFPDGEEREAAMTYIVLDIEDAFDLELPPQAEAVETVKELMIIIRSVM